ncbi:MAG TPA: SDR family oxidoreductase [Anaerolineaceae bacterium]|nr:SDR family oxidoreductase [Anaerolineaceae bacterium]
MILVTGATGHIGNTLIRELIARGERVRALVVAGEDRTCLDGLQIEVITGDILNPDSICRAMQGVRSVYHLAGIISILPGKDERIRRVNVEGTRNVVTTALCCGVERLLYTSSIHALSRPPQGRIIDESLPFDIHNPAGEYDRTKAEASLVVLDAIANGLDAVVVCPTGVIGPYDYRISEMGALIRSWMAPGVFVLVDGMFDFVDVRDVARGMILALERGRTGEAYILSGQRIPLAQLKEMVQEAGGQRTPHLIVPLALALIIADLVPIFARLFHTRALFTRYSLETVVSNSEIDCVKAREELGYQTRPLQQTITDTIEWWKGRAVSAN